LDLDEKDFQGGKEEALRRLREFRLAPTLIVDTGRGFHAYWFFKEAESIQSEADIVRIESYNRRLAQVSGGDLAVAEIARVMRLPGTYHMKNPATPLLVRILELEPSRRYNLSTFDDWLPAPEQQEARSTYNPPGWVGDLLRDLREGRRGDCHNAFGKMIGKIISGRVDADDLLALFAPHLQLVTHQGHQYSREDLRKQVEDMCPRYSRKKKSFLSPSLYREGKSETETTPLTTIPLTQLLAVRETEIHWCVRHLIPAEGVAILGGWVGLGKSWLLHDLATEVARGGPWLGKFQTTAGRVVYVDEESSLALLRFRLRKLLNAKGLVDTNLDIHLVVGGGLCLTDPGSVERLRQVLAALRPKLVIVDSLIRVHRAQENSATEMAAVFDTVKRLVREFRCAFTFSDHQRKLSQLVVSQDQHLRGSGEKAAFTDTLLSMQKDSHHEVLIVEHSKSRFAQPVPAFLVQIKDTGAEQTSVAYVGEARAVKQTARDEVAKAFLERALCGQESITRQQLVKWGTETGISEKAIDKALKALVKDGCVERDKGEQEGRGGKPAIFRWKVKENIFPSLSPATGTETERSTGDSFSILLALTFEDDVLVDELAEICLV